MHRRGWRSLETNQEKVMSIHTRKYKSINRDEVARVVQIKEENLLGIVAYICRNGGAATGHNARPQFNRPARIRIKQLTQGKTWSKFDWRVALIGDYIIRYQDDTFERVKAADFNKLFTLVTTH
jgi:aryl-alcohol dehydrogenase-like predicted oxidoreductase